MMSTGASREGFIAANGLWSEEQKSAARALSDRIEKEQIRAIRVAVPDAQAKLRAKTMMPGIFGSGLVNGVEFTAAHFSFDTAEGIAYNPFSVGGGVGIEEFQGFANGILVPDPQTFKVLPWAPGIGWILGDMYFHDGRPIPFDARHKLKEAIASLKGVGFSYVAGLEIEFYVTRVINPNLGVEQMGNLGIPATPPEVEALWRGFAYQSEENQDAVQALTDAIIDNCLKLQLPLRTIEDEMGPGQIEVTFDIQDPLEAADTLVLFRSMIKQITARMGLHATFMAKPKFTSFVASGWHLHQSLAFPDGGNAFVSTESPPQLLSDAGRHFVGGILKHAAEASVFTTPTINGYRRRKPNSLAPDRATWGYDNRAAMIRVQGTPGEPSVHIENRVGEPCANPYLYIASQILAGVDGIRNRIDPGAMDDSPYEATSRAKLPVSLIEAVEALDQSAFYREAMGDSFIDWLIGMKRSEISRFLSSEPDWTDNPDVVTEWEHREYFTRY
jgi:glutamine synthetase